MSKFISRRAFSLGATVGVVSLSAIPPLLRGQSIFDNSGLANLLGSSGDAFDQSLQGAYSFLNTMMDAYAAGSTVRLVQSYSDKAFAPFPSVAFTYDNAVTIMAYLARGMSGDVQRAIVLGHGLVHAQKTNFPVADGRFAQAYYVNTPDATGAYITPCAFPFYFYSSSVGDQAWAGLALAQLYHHTGTKAFLTAALSVANWIVTNTYDTQGPGGYRFGAVITPSNTSAPSGNGKSTEHNIDTFAFFTMLAELTNNAAATSNVMTWRANANHALTFVQAMFNASGGFFYTGTQADQVTTNTYPIPEDVQTWSYLALQSKTYGVSLDWVKSNLATLDTPSSPASALTGLGNINVQGETFDTASLATSGNDPEAVWLEGTAHTVAALLSRRAEKPFDSWFSNGDLETALTLLQNLRFAQAKLGAGQTVNGLTITLGQGLVAATGNLDTGFGYDYYPNLHIGATGWYAVALRTANPFQLGLRSQNW